MTTKRGRPPLPEEERRHWRVSVALTETEYENLAERADREGITLSDAARAILKRALARKGKR